MEDQWLAWAKRLQALASTGLYFEPQVHDQERYLEVADIAQQMLSALGQISPQQIVQLHPDFAQSYATPLIDVRGAVFRGEDILLVKEKTDQRWTLPGGYADVGLSAAQNVEKEISEEANLVVKARALYAVKHKAKHAYRPDVRDFYKLFFLCEQLEDGEPFAGTECLDARYFRRNELPDLSTGRVITHDIEAAYDFRAHPQRFTAFD
jgi:ADP-ribose pyrophosphatase YjhB (NUDIX family)